MQSSGGPAKALSIEVCLALQSEEILAFRAETWQRQLHEAWKASDGDPVGQKRSRDRLCLQVQIPIAGKYGFEASVAGVGRRLKLARQLMTDDQLEKTPMLANNSSWLIWLTDPLEQLCHPHGPVDTEMQSSVGPMIPLASLVAMQREEIVAFGSETWQKELHEVWKAAEGDPLAQKRERDKLCLQVQIPIVCKFGFEASAAGVANRMIAGRQKWEETNNALLKDNGAWLNWLTQPAAQIEQPDGPSVIAMLSSSVDPIVANAEESCFERDKLPDSEVEQWQRQDSSRSSEFETQSSAASDLVFSETKCLALQSEEILAFRAQLWQKQLHEMWKALEGDSAAQEKGRRKLCLQVQIPIAGKFGFEASVAGVAMRMRMVTEDMRQRNAMFGRNSSWLLWLTWPSKQMKHPNGPPGTEMQSSVGPVMPMSAESILSLQSEELLAFRSEAFQRQLHEMWNESEGDHLAQKQGRERLCCQLRIPIIARFGFEPSKMGVLHRLTSVTYAIQEANPRIALNGHWLRWLADPALQLAFPSGPANPTANGHRELVKPADYIFKEELVGQSMPDWRTLSQVPRTITIRVLSALSGNFLCGLELNNREWVLGIKREIHRLKGIPADEQEILLDGRVLHNAEEIGEVVDLFLHNHRLEQGDDSDDDELCDCLIDVNLVRLCPRGANVEDLRCGFAMPWDWQDASCNRESMLAAVIANGLALENASDELRADKDLVRLAVNNDGLALQFAAETLRAERDLVLAAVQASGKALQFASAAMRCDQQVVLAAVANDATAVRYAKLKNMADDVRQSILRASGENIHQ